MCLAEQDCIDRGGGRDYGKVTAECPEELYNLTQLAEVSLAAAAGHVFHTHTNEVSGLT